MENVKNESVYEPRVSIIVPVKNCEATIRELLESLMHLDYNKEKLEVIVVDGNSTDKTCEIVSKYLVKLLKEERPGINAARNTGIKYSKGEIIAFTDGDCVVTKDWVKKITEKFKDPKVGCVGGNVIGYYDNVLSNYCDESILPVMRVFKKREILKNIKPPLHYPAGCNMAMKRKVVKDVGMFDERIKHGFDEDEFVERVCDNGYSMVLDPEVLVEHKHRLTLLELLKQTFNYGRGGGLLLKIKGAKSKFSRWIILSLASFIFWVSMLLSTALYTFFTGSIASLIVFLVFLLLPPAGLTFFYIHQTLSRKDGKYIKIIFYPCIDILRALSFITGTLYQLFKKES